MQVNEPLPPNITADDTPPAMTEEPSTSVPKATKMDDSTETEKLLSETKKNESW